MRFSNQFYIAAPKIIDLVLNHFKENNDKMAFALADILDFMFVTWSAEPGSGCGSDMAFLYGLSALIRSKNIPALIRIRDSITGDNPHVKSLS